MMAKHPGIPADLPFRFFVGCQPWLGEIWPYYFTNPYLGSIPSVGPYLYVIFPRERVGLRKGFLFDLFESIPVPQKLPKSGV